MAAAVVSRGMRTGAIDVDPFLIDDPAKRTKGDVMAASIARKAAGIVQPEVLDVTRDAIEFRPNFRLLRRSG